MIVTQLPPAGDPGATLKRLREARGLTQQDLADKLGKTRTAVAAWEYGRRMSHASRAAVAKLFGVPPDTFGAAWDPNQARPQHGRRDRQERAYMATLRDLAATPEGDRPSTTGVDPDRDGGVTSGSLPSRKDFAEMVDLPDRDLLQKVIGLWCAMEPESRMTLLREAWTLANPAGTSERAGRGKAQG